MEREQERELEQELEHMIIQFPKKKKYGVFAGNVCLALFEWKRGETVSVKEAA